MSWKLVTRSQCRRLCSCGKALAAPKHSPLPAALVSTSSTRSDQENKKTVEKLCKLSVDIRKIRRLKEWVLLEEETYVEEVASILEQLGADGAAVAGILERCPEAVVCSPAAVNTQRELWQSLCKGTEELVKLIEQFPEAFFTVKDHERRKLNVQFFQELGLRNVVISRFLTTAPSIFQSPVEKNRQVIKTLQESYLRLGGSEANMKVWLLKLLSQNPFVLLNPSAAVKETLEFLQEQGFTDLELLQLLSKLKGFLFQLCPRTLQNSLSFSKSTFKCTDRDLRALVLQCPALLYYSVPVLEERIQGLLKEGISIAQIRAVPMVLELTPQIVQYRIRKLDSLGCKIKDGHLASINGTKKEFEASFGKIQAKKGRPLFNPVAPLAVEE